MRKNLQLRDVIITLGMLTYNTEEISHRCFTAILEEAKKLRALVAKVNLVVVDNGNDGFKEGLNSRLAHFRGGPLFSNISLMGDGLNRGQGIGRNCMVDQALDFGSDFLLSVDGDISVVPNSTLVMARYMLERQGLGCLSADPYKSTPDKDKATAWMSSIKSTGRSLRTACTGYALFDMDMFRNGIRFEANGPFGGPGWGLEDDDLCIQMLHAGWDVQWFGDVRYLHYKQRSSWGPLAASGVDINQIFEARKGYLMEKWRTKIKDQRILLRIKGQSIRSIVHGAAHS